MVNVVIIMWQGLIEDVKVFKESKPAEDFFTKETDVAWSEFMARHDTEDSETILADYAGSNIWEVNLE